MKKIEFYFDSFLSQIIEKEIRTLFVSYLVYLEELMDAGRISEDEYSNKRKEILDRGNSSIRIIKEQLESIFSNIKVI